jgi:isochorismate synthase
MRTQLKYRIPGASVVNRKGDFQALYQGQPIGFVVTDFSGRQVYQFKEAAAQEYKANPMKPKVISKSAYLEIATDLKRYLSNTEGKVVLSRIRRESFSIHPELLFNALCETYPDAFVYLIISNELGVWVGATPEILLSRDGEKLKSMALAGTRRTKGDVKWSEKEYEEHDFVVDFIQSNLDELNVKSVKVENRREQISGPVKHLCTDFIWQSEMNEDWRIAQRLHPTPAVSGWPVEEAVRQIGSLEQHERSLYTGIIGLLGEETRLFVNLRCAQIIQDSIFLYLGGGLTKDSVPIDEWKETENKASTLLNVLHSIKEETK